MKRLFKKQQNLFFLSLVCFICLGLIIFFVYGLSPNKEPLANETLENNVSLTQTEIIFRHPLTGKKSHQVINKPSVYSVMVENSADAWPLSGLEKAFLVIEAPVEGNIPRFLAFYSSDVEVEKIGPVRSARPYYLDWANEFFSLYAHVGGSDQALDLIASGETFDLNQFFFGSFFWRSSDRFAPHNVYTSSELLSQAFEQKKNKGYAREPLYEVWSFKDHLIPTNFHDVPEVSIQFSPVFGYEATWVYEPSMNRYERKQNGQKFLLQNGEMIFADNIAIMITDITVINAIGHRSIRTLGQGEAIILQDGQIILGSWKKNSVKNRLRFYDENNQEIIWNPGITWVEVVSLKEAVQF